VSDPSVGDVHDEREDDRRAAMAKRKPIIQAIVTSLLLVLVPATFAGMMVWAMQNPLNRLDHVPAAVVNEDVAVTMDKGDSTTTVNLGREIIDNLAEKNGGDNFSWTVTNASDATSGLRDGRYFVVLTIPATFSADATSSAAADPADPRTAELTVTTNDALNYLTGTISKSMGDSIAATVSQKVASKYVENVQLHFNDLHDNLSTAVDKTVKLVDGAQDARGGAAKLVDGLEKLKTKTAEMPAKVDKLKTGAQNLLDGATKLNSGSQSLNTGARKLADGAATASTNASKLSTGASKMATNLASLDTGAGKFSAALSQLSANYDAMPDAQRKAMINQLAIQAKSLAGGATQAANGAQSLASGAKNMDSGLSTLASGAQKILTGSEALKTGAAKELAGAQKEYTGASNMDANIPQLVTGAQAAYDGGVKLYDGLGSMQTGSKMLHDKLAAGVKNMPTYTEAQLSTLPDLTSTAATSDSTHLNAIDEFGQSLAPFFLPIALWIGCLAFFMINPPLSAKALKARQPAPVVFLKSLALPSVVAIAQALVAVWAVHALVGIEVTDLGGLALLAMLVSLTFMCTNQAFGALFGPAGRFLSILFLIVQAASAAGVFPIQTAPPFVQWLAGILPLGHATQAIRSQIAGGSLGLDSALSLLVIWLVSALVLVFLGAVITRRRTARAAAEARDE
jgi:putative membrane protein